MAKVVYLALRCARPRRARVTSVRPAYLYHYGALANGKKFTSRYASQACVSARVVLTVASCMHYNTHYLIRPSQSVFPGFKT